MRSLSAFRDMRHPESYCIVASYCSVLFRAGHTSSSSYLLQEVYPFVLRVSFELKVPKLLSIPIIICTISAS